MKIKVKDEIVIEYEVEATGYTINDTMRSLNDKLPDILGGRAPYRIDGLENCLLTYKPRTITMISYPDCP